MSIPASLEEQLAAALARVAELEAEKEAPKVEAAAENVAEKAVDAVKHWLHLADGSVTENSGAVPTHVAKQDGTVVPVTAAYEQQNVSA